MLQARINDDGILGEALRLYFDVNVPSSYTQQGYWLPSFLAGLGTQADSEARAIDQNASLLPPEPLQNFTIDSSDSEIVNGNKVEFIFSINGSYALQVTDPNDPRTIKPYSFRIAGIRTQQNGVTMLSNVINPHFGEQAKLLYTITSAGQVTIMVFTLNGDVIDTLFRGYRSIREYSLTWDGKNRERRSVTRGLYFIKVVAPGVEEIRKILVVKYGLLSLSLDI